MKCTIGGSKQDGLIAFETGKKLSLTVYTGVQNKKYLHLYEFVRGAEQLTYFDIELHQETMYTSIEDDRVYIAVDNEKDFKKVREGLIKAGIEVKDYK